MAGLPPKPGTKDLTMSGVLGTAMVTFAAASTTPLTGTEVFNVVAGQLVASVSELVQQPETAAPAS
jgi:hypothetical protein